MKPLALAFLTLFVLPIFTFSQSTAPPYLDPSLPIDTRVNDLVSRLTLDEKISQMQDVAPAIPRLNIPAYNWWNEGLHGVARSGTATVFPQAIGLAATWDTDLLHRVADVISTEARAKYNDALSHNNTGRYYGLTFWSPNINIFRDPRWGRGQETYGEDPFLTARLAVAFVTGLQGDDARYLKTVSTPKHYAVHSGPEVLRHRFDVPVSLHDLYDTYTPAFRAAVIDGRADSIMCAYNSVRGEPACANRLLFDLLRNQWRFRGYVVSDCWALNDLYQGHNYVMSLDQAAALSLKAGTDLSCGPQFKILDHALADRLLSVDDIDRAVKRLFEARFRLGMFDPPANVPWSKLTLADVDTSTNRKLALDAARESIVLLKNERPPNHDAGPLTLPLKPNIKSIAVIGPTADSYDSLLGNYNGSPSSYTTILAGITKRFPHAKITYAVGAPLTESRAIPIPSSALRTVAVAQGSSCRDRLLRRSAKSTSTEVSTTSTASGAAPFGSPRAFLARGSKGAGLESTFTQFSTTGNTRLLHQVSASGSFVAATGVGASAPTLTSGANWPSTPEELLFPPSSQSQATSSQLGLTAEYFPNVRLDGAPLVSRVDPSVDFEWDNVSPAPGVPAENFSVRWSGELVPPVDGNYRLGADSDGGFRLYLNNKLLIDDWAPHGERAITTLVHLDAGHSYPIKLEYFHNFWESTVRLVWLPPTLLDEAVPAAHKSDVVIAVVGITAQLEGEESFSSDPGFFGGDRTDITLPTTQQQLLEALAATGRPLVVVLTSGSALAVNWASEHASAILEAWYPGEEGGAAVADVLSGDYNPAGRLPVTFYKSVAQLPPFTDYSMFNRTYRYFAEAPLFPFGFGLSYSTFSYSDVSAKPAPAAPTTCCTAFLQRLTTPPGAPGAAFAPGNFASAPGPASPANSPGPGFHPSACALCGGGFARPGAAPFGSPRAFLARGSKGAGLESTLAQLSTTGDPSSLKVSISGLFVGARGVGASAPTLATSRANWASAPEELPFPSPEPFAQSQAPTVRHTAVSQSDFPGNAPILVSARVTNTSSIPGDEVVQLYISHPNIEGAPLRALVGFHRLHLAPNASEIVNFTLTPRELSIVDPNGNRYVPAGPLVLWIGSSQPLTIPRLPAYNGRSIKLTLSSSVSLPN